MSARLGFPAETVCHISPKRHFTKVSITLFTMLSILRTRALRTTTPLSRTITARINSSAPTRACPSCGAPIPYPASPCPSCAALVPIPPALSLHSLLDVSTPIVNPGGKDTFDIPGELSTLPAHGYDLSPRDLRARMLKRQAALHPDRHNGVDLAADLSGMINKAYETLANPLKRADYIVCFTAGQADDS